MRKRLRRWVSEFELKPILRRPWDWSIGLYRGTSPFELSGEGIANPILTAKSVSDMDAAMVADPFMVNEGGNWYLFFEIWPRYSDKGVIGLAVSANLKDWDYEGVVLDEDFHLSYPQVFQEQDTWYMLPEAAESGFVALYKSTRFPFGWERSTILVDKPYHDATLFRQDDMWCIFASVDSKELRLFTADSLGGSWKEHSASPIVTGDKHRTRPAGSIFSHEGQTYRTAQDPAPIYGSRVWTVPVLKITETIYEEGPPVEQPLLSATGEGWNAVGMHHLDAHQLGENEWVACVDGCAGRRTLLF